MPNRLLFVFALLITGFGCQSAQTQPKPDAATTELVEFSSDESISRLEASKAKVDFFGLANQFEAQSNGLFCGPTTATIVLNTVYAGQPNLAPKDRSRLRKRDLRYLPEGVDPAVARHTQESVFQRSPKSRAEVFGKPASEGAAGKDFGYQLRQLDALLRAHGLETKLRVADGQLGDQTILDELIQNLSTRGDYVIVNYKRTEVGQEGGGHISPLGAYDEKSNSFLVLDVNPSKAKWVWMPAATLIKGMRSFDTVENRGYILVKGK